MNAYDNYHVNALIVIPPCLWAITFLTFFPIMPFLIMFKVIECGGR